MRANRETLLFWASMISALQTPITLLQSSWVITKCSAILIGLLGLTFLILLFLRKHGIVIFGEQILVVVRQIEKIKQKADAFDPKGNEWNRKLEDLRFILSDILDRRPNRWFCSELRTVSLLHSPWEVNDGINIGLKTAFLRTRILCGTFEFLKDFHGWRMSGMGKSAPGRGIDANIDPLIKREIAKRIHDRFASWFSAHRKCGDWVSVLFVGANDRVLSALILDSMRDVSGCRGLQVFIAGTADENKLYLRLRYGKDDKIGNSDKIILQRKRDRQPKYDIAIATHYYQHHELTHYKRLPLNIVRDGMVVWLSALSRSPTVDEFVCEGCIPLRATLLSQKLSESDSQLKSEYGTRIVEIESMTNRGVRERIAYEPIRGFEDHLAVLSSGYPKKFIVNQETFYNDPTGVVSRYLLWNKQQRISQLLIKSEYNESKTDDARFQYNVRGINKVVETRVCGGGSSAWYGVFELQYESEGLRSLYLIANTGLEINEWDSMARGKGQCLVTITPAISYITGAEAWDKDAPSRLVKEALKQRLENDDIIRREKYEILVDRSRLETMNSQVAVFEMRTKMEDVELNHLRFIVARRAVDKHDAVFCSYLPKRRYLSQCDYDVEYGIMEDFKHEVKKMDEATLKEFMPVMTHSVTWLRSIKGLISDFRKRGLIVDEGATFFHKSLGRLMIDNEEKEKYEGMEVDFDSLSSAKHAVAKDVAFNQLPFEDRIKFLGIANVHDVLLFATPRAAVTHHHTRKAYRLYIMRQLHISIKALLVNLALFFKGGIVRRRKENKC